MDATLPVLVKLMAEERPLTPYQSEIRMLLKKAVATGEWNRRDMNDASEELQVISERLALIESQLQRIMDLLSSRDVPE